MGERDLRGAGRIVFVGNARCYHTMDWYRAVKKLCKPRPVVIATDLIESEGHRKLVDGFDEVVRLVNIDRLLLRTQSEIGNLWRNAVKLLMIPLQAYKLRKIYRNWPYAVYHAHTMYYMCACWLARIPFIGTPQGSEILLRPKRSSLYQYFAVRALQAAKTVTVDSVHMRDEILRLSGVRAEIIQNGVDVDSLVRASRRAIARSIVLSFRGMTPLYRIHEIVAARALSTGQPDLTFIYPFWDEDYRQQVAAEFRAGDRDLGRLDKEEMNALLARTVLAISIPTSDSSPRSVYEAIFAGACVAATAGRWMEVLPACMREYLVVVDPSTPGWFDRAYEQARAVVARPYQPSNEALKMFDQRRSMRAIIQQHYSVQQDLAE